MYELVRIATKELEYVIKDLKWLDDDAKESKLIAGWDIPTVILKQQRLDPINFIVLRDKQIVSVIIIAFDGSLTYFDTTAMLNHQLGYLKFLKPKLEAYVDLMDIRLVVSVATWYTTSIKKLKLLGFELLEDHIDRAEYGKSHKSS